LRVVGCFQPVSLVLNSKLPRFGVLRYPRFLRNGTPVPLTRQTFPAPKLSRLSSTSGREVDVKTAAAAASASTIGREELALTAAARRSANIIGGGATVKTAAAVASVSINGCGASAKTTDGPRARKHKATSEE